MNMTFIGLIGIALMFLFMAFRMNIGLAMALSAFIGTFYMLGFSPAFSMLSTVPYRTAANYEMSVIPLFVLMSNFTFYSGVSENLFTAAYKWLGHIRGGLAMATVAGCAGFAAICGSSVATAVTIGTVALPEMKKYNYDSGLATGSLAAGGTLGILIPPSLGFILYSMLTSESIGKLFIAGILPGILLCILFIVTIYIIAKINPSSGPQGPSATFKDKVFSLKNIWEVIILFLVVMGGMYAGIFTPIEAAGIGSFAAFVIMVAKRKLSRKNLAGALFDTGKMSAMCYIILMGAAAFGYFMGLTRVPNALAEFTLTLQVSKWVILAVILFIYVILGMLMDTIAMTVITVPIFQPLIVGAGFDPIWWGVIMVIMSELALITPPVGINVFVVSGMAKVPMEAVFKGIFPFCLAMAACVLILIIFPQIALFLPGFMK